MLDQPDSSLQENSINKIIDNTSKSGDLNSEENHYAILVLDPPPKPWTKSNWYMQEIAGVPFLIRNILTVQRTNAKKLFIFQNDGLEDKILKKTLEDPRISIEIEFISDQDEFFDILEKNAKCLLLNGSFLYQTSQFTDVFHSKPFSQTAMEGAYSLNIENMKKAINSNQLRISEIEKVIMQGESDVENRSRFYISGKQGSKVEKDSDFLSQSEKLFQTCGLSNDSFMDRLVTRRVSRQLTRIFVQTSMTPNQITGLSLGLGLLAAWLFYFGNYTASLFGAGIFLLSAWIDCTDGEVARLKFQESKFGGILDIFSDNIVHFAVFYCIGMGLYFSTGNSIYKILGILAVIGSAVSFALMYSKVVKEKSQASEGKEAIKNSGGFDLTAQMANRDFIYLVFILAIAGQLWFFISITAIGANVFAFILVYARFIKPNIDQAESIK
ncbi:MAG: CDP-alcohol phosphatidyltransferase family protein [Nitrospinales bacterium]